MGGNFDGDIDLTLTTASAASATPDGYFLSYAGQPGAVSHARAIGGASGAQSVNGVAMIGAAILVGGTFEAGSAPAAAAPPDPRLAVRFDRHGDNVEIAMTRDGAPAEPEPYLGARGHLVALRAGDLAYLHVHPLEGGAPAVRFMAELPTAGPYSLFFDYQVGGVVHTATTSIEVQ